MRKEDTRREMEHERQLLEIGNGHDVRLNLGKRGGGRRRRRWWWCSSETWKERVELLVNLGLFVVGGWFLVGGTWAAVVSIRENLKMIGEGRGMFSCEDNSF